MLDRPGFDVSFSGLKTAVVQALAPSGAAPYPPELAADVAASFQAAVVDTLAEKTRRALEHVDARALTLGGGVACNRALRERLAGAVRGARRPVSRAVADGCAPITRR